MTTKSPRRVAIQGEPGSFHHAAARQLCGDDIELVCCATFGAVFQAVQSGSADIGVVACENSLYGSIAEVYDLLLHYRLPITGEHIEHIHQNLITHPEADLTSIREIYSHPVALNQCRAWLAANLPKAELIEHHDTAGAVDEISLTPSPYMAAIAGSEAAQLYGLPILAANIEDEKTNLTRFLLLDSAAQPAVDATKASLVLTTSHQPGALYRALGIFAEANANLTKLESRPIRGEAFHYQFIIDVMCDIKSLHTIQSALEAQNCRVDLLGYYTTGA